MRAKGENLIFISRILRDGSGVEAIASQQDTKHVQATVFDLQCLSITQGTYIASEFNCYVVRKKEAKK